MSKKVITGKVRASYVNVFRKKVNQQSGKEEYSMMLLIPKSDKKTVEKIKSAVDEAAEGKWGKKLPTKLKSPLRDGDDEFPGEDAYAGNYFMNVKSSTNKPQIVDKDLQEIIDERDFQSGDYCRVSINAYAYDVSGNRGVAFGLNNIQVMAKGEPLGGSSSRASDDFDALDDDDDFLAA